MSTQNPRPSEATIYGGFGRRFVAKMIDNFIVGAANIAFRAAVGGELRNMWFIPLVQIMFQVGYSSAFLERFGATPGKMVLGMKVVTAGYETLGPLRAFLRSVTELLSGLLLYVGYIMAAFDKRVRTLHDRICGTCVVRT